MASECENKEIIEIRRYDLELVKRENIDEENLVKLRMSIGQ